MRQNWHHLTFLHWPVDAAALRPLIPEPLELDTFEGTAWIGLIPFTMTGIRHAALPILPGASRFHETNVRTYVRLGEDAGVWFLSLDASSALAVRVARAWFHLPYHRAQMRLRLGRTIRYEAQRDETAGYTVEVEPHGKGWEAAPGSLEHFLIERYRLFARSSRGLFSARVRHEPYRIQSAKLLDLDESLLAATGVERPEGAPLVHYSLGVTADVFGLRPCRR